MSALFPVRRLAKRSPPPPIRNKKWGWGKKWLPCVQNLRKASWWLYPVGHLNVTCKWDPAVCLLRDSSHWAVSSVGVTRQPQFSRIKWPAKHSASSSSWTAPQCHCSTCRIHEAASCLHMQSEGRTTTLSGEVRHGNSTRATPRCPRWAAVYNGTGATASQLWQCFPSPFPSLFILLPPFLQTGSWLGERQCHVLLILLHSVNLVRPAQALTDRTEMGSELDKLKCWPQCSNAWFSEGWIPMEGAFPRGRKHTLDH